MVPAKARVGIGVVLIVSAAALWMWHAAGVLTAQLAVSYTWSDLITHEVITVDRQKLVKFGGSLDKQFPEQDGAFLMRGTLPRLWLPNGLACLLISACGFAALVSGLIDMRRHPSK